MDPGEDLYRTSVGEGAPMDFRRLRFTKKPAIVVVDANGRKSWREYRTDRMTPGATIEKDGWDHEHCCACFLRISEGDDYWENSSGRLLCPECLASMNILAQPFSAAGERLILPFAIASDGSPRLEALVSDDSPCQLLP